MSTQPKAIILDMDGTMLNHVNEISDSLTDYVIQLRKQGKIVFIATGRTLKEIKDIIPKDFELDGIVCSNGMAVYAEGKQIINHTLAPDLVRELVDRARETNIYYEVHPVDSAGVSLKKDKQWFEEEITDPKPETVKEDEWLARHDALERDIEWKKSLPLDSACKIYFFSRNKKQITLWKQILDEVKQKQEFSAFSSSDHNIEVMEKNISKATGIQYLLDKFHLKNEEVMMIGDSENDLPIMEIAGYSVAMQNAPDRVKEKVDEITTFSHREDGLYRYLYERFENENKNKSQQPTNI